MGGQRAVFSVSDPAVDPYGLLTSLVVPRPIAWITTVSADGVNNLAPHSFFNVACEKPPLVSFSSVGRKDTLRNIHATEFFVVNLVSRPLAELANASSAPFAPEVEEAAILGIELEPSDLVPVPRVSGAMASIECRLHSSIRLGNSTLVIGSVKGITVRKEAIVDGRPSLKMLQPVSRLGADEWGLPPEVFRLPRPGRPDPA